MVRLWFVSVFDCCIFNHNINCLLGMEVTDWLSLCAIHSDSWLMALLFFFGARFNYAGRAELFSLANQHPTIYEVVTERVGRNTVYKRQDGSGNTYIPESLRRVEEPAIRSQPSGRIIRPNELTTALCGKKAELYWPDDGKWYLVEIQSIDMDTKMAKYVFSVLYCEVDGSVYFTNLLYNCRVRYATNEEEELNLLEVIEDNQMSLLG